MLFVFCAVAAPLIAFASAGNVPLAKTEHVIQAQDKISENYVSLKATQKLDTIWNKILATKNKKGNEPWTIEKLKLLFACHDEKVFTHESDFMISGRKKLIHFYQGSTIKVEWISTGDHNYTGFFETGTKEAIMRISQADEPKKKMTPGFAIKIFVDGMKSQNIFAMFSLDGQPEPSFFANAFTNIVPEPKEFFPLQSAFADAKLQAGDKTSPLWLPVKHVAQHTANGSTIAEPKYPFKLFFVPTPELQALTKNATFKSDTRKLVEGKGEGMNLYDVYAFDTQESVQLKKIATVKGLSGFVASAFGDDILHFEHHMLK